MGYDEDSSMTKTRGVLKRVYYSVIEYDDVSLDLLHCISTVLYQVVKVNIALNKVCHRA
jgi:hypothetical protein